MPLRIIFSFILFLCSASVNAAVNITIGEGNEISIPEEYASPAWSAVWYLENQNKIPDALLKQNSPTSVSVLSNVGYMYGILTENSTGQSVRTSAVNADRLRSKIAKIKLDGTGTATSITLINNGVTHYPDFSVEIAGIVAEAPVGLATVILPPLYDKVGEYDINVNFPDRIGGINLDNMGISAIDIDKSCKNLLELSLDGNALGFDGLPDWIPDKCIVDYGTQSPIHISTLSDGITVDLSAQKVSDLIVSWFTDSNEEIDEDLYECDGLIYTFTGYVGKAWCRLSSLSRGLTLRSTIVDIGSDMRPLFTASWAGAAGNAVFAIGVTDNVLVAIDDGPTQLLLPGEDNWLRMPETSGTMTVNASDVSSVCSLDLKDIGLSNLIIHDKSSEIARIYLGNNKITPDNIPKGIPIKCEVDWGSQAAIDISGLVNRQERWVDLTGFDDINVQWVDNATGNQLSTQSFTERPRGLFTFTEDVSDIRAVISSALYEGLKWDTSVVHFPVYNSSLDEIIDDMQAYFHISDRSIVSDYSGSLYVYTLDGRLVKEIAPRGHCSLSSGLYIVVGAGRSRIIRL